jgi:hypothetical protein
MKWISVNKNMPESGRVLTYSPIYEGKDESMTYRLLDSQFLKYTKDVTHWCEPKPPKELITCLMKQV